MSLFKARDWWATNAGSDEEFDLGCLCVANIDNNGLQIGKEATSFISVLSRRTSVHFKVFVSFHGFSKKKPIADDMT